MNSSTYATKTCSEIVLLSMYVHVDISVGWLKLRDICISSALTRPILVFVIGAVIVFPSSCISSHFRFNTNLSEYVCWLFCLCYVICHLYQYGTRTVLNTWHNRPVAESTLDLLTGQPVKLYPLYVNLPSSSAPSHVHSCIHSDTLTYMTLYIWMFISLGGW